MIDRLKQIDEIKARIDGHRPLDAHMIKQVREYFRIGMTYSSNALEGNSLTETETKVVIEDGVAIGESPSEIILKPWAIQMPTRLSENSISSKLAIIITSTYK